jgi:hypothetical protein
LLEFAERLADGGLADTKLASQARLNNAVPGLKGAVEDLIPQVIAHVVA